MKLSNFKAAGAFVAAIGFLGFAVTVAQAQTANTPKVPQKHDSNTLHRLGSAIQYPFRKAAENASQATHTTTKAKSVQHDRNLGHNFVLKPNGTKVFKSTVNPYVKHHHYRHHHHHHYMKK